MRYDIEGTDGACALSRCHLRMLVRRVEEQQGRYCRRVSELCN
jgi:hypothetical protein